MSDLIYKTSTGVKMMLMMAMINSDWSLEKCGTRTLEISH